MKFTNLAFKFVLPALALALIAYAAYRTQTGRPDDSALPPAIAPAVAPAVAHAATPAEAASRNAAPARVAGAGVVEPSSELVTIAPNASGVVSAVSVVAGDRVTKGQVLFTLDARELDAELKTRRSAITAQQRNVELAEADLADKAALLNLYQQIDDPRATSREELLRRQGASAQAQARLRAAQAQRDQAESELQRTSTQRGMLAVKAPLDATVLQVRLRAGEFAAAGGSEALMVLGQTLPLHVRIDVDEADVPRLAAEQPASVSPRGSANIRVEATFVRSEPLLGPKRSLTNAADERVDTRVLQVIYALPADAKGVLRGPAGGCFLERCCGALSRHVVPASSQPHGRYWCRSGCAGGLRRARWFEPAQERQPTSERTHHSADASFARAL